MRLSKQAEAAVLAWLGAHDKQLFAEATTITEGHRQCIAACHVAISHASFHRLVLYAHTCGRLRWWRGGRGGPLPTTRQTSAPAITLAFAAADIRHRIPDIDVKREQPAFIARLLTNSGFPCSPDEAAHIVACLNDDGGKR